MLDRVFKQDQVHFVDERDPVVFHERLAVVLLNRVEAIYRLGVLSRSCLIQIQILIVALVAA